MKALIRIPLKIVALAQVLGLGFSMTASVAQAADPRPGAITLTLVPHTAVRRPSSAAVKQAPASPALNTALENAVKKAQIEAIKKLLIQGADANYRTSGATRDPLLWVALSHNQPRIVKLLLKAGARADVSDHRGTPILIGALSLANAKTTRETALFKSILGLLNKGHANPNAQDKAYVGDSRGPLHMAVSLGSRDLVQLLLDFGANPNLGNRSQETPLHFAAERGYTDIVQLLLARGANIDALTKHTHMTPLLAAAENGHAEIVRLLIAKGARTDARDTFGKSAEQLLKASVEKHRMTAAKWAQTELALRAPQTLSK